MAALFAAGVGVGGASSRERFLNPKASVLKRVTVNLSEHIMGISYIRGVLFIVT